MIDRNHTASDWGTARTDLLILPVGAFEQHGPHLPMDTDCRIAEYFSRILSVAVLPQMPEHLVAAELFRLYCFLFARNDSSNSHVQRVKNYIQASYMTGLTVSRIAAEMNLEVSKVEEILKVAQEPVSLETPIGEEEDSHLGDFIQDEEASQPAEAATYTLLQEQLCEVLNTLTPREEQVLRMRFGLTDGKSHTLEEVGKEFDVTRERVRQIESKALRKLRHPSRSKKLRDFLS